MSVGMNPVTDPPRTRRRGPSTSRHDRSTTRQLIDARLAAQGLELDVLMRGWFEAKVTWPDLIERVARLTDGVTVTKNTFKSWFPWYRLPATGPTPKPARS